jgi:hypothetical protein
MTMPSDNLKQLNIWKIAHEYLARVRDARKAMGESSASLTVLASQAILNIPMPTNGHTPPADPCPGEEKK